MRNRWILRRLALETVSVVGFPIFLNLVLWAIVVLFLAATGARADEPLGGLESSGGGLSSSDIDAEWLRLDTTNDPLTGNLEIETNDPQVILDKGANGTALFSMSNGTTHEAGLKYDGVERLILQNDQGDIVLASKGGTAYSLRLFRSTNELRLYPSYVLELADGLVESEVSSGGTAFELRAQNALSSGTAFKVTENDGAAQLIAVDHQGDIDMAASSEIDTVSGTLRLEAAAAENLLLQTDGSAVFHGDVDPKDDSTDSLGTTSKRWSEAHVDEVVFGQDQAADPVNLPNCTASLEGTVLYTNDTGDGDEADLCVCVDENDAGSYGWKPLVGNAAVSACDDGTG